MSAICARTLLANHHGRALPPPGRLVDEDLINSGAQASAPEAIIADKPVTTDHIGVGLARLALGQRGDAGQTIISMAGIEGI